MTLADALEQAGLSSEASAAIANGSATLREAAMQILSLAEELLQAQQTPTEGAENGTAQTAENAGLTDAAADGALPNVFDSNSGNLAGIDPSGSIAPETAETQAAAENAMPENNTAEGNAGKDNANADAAGAGDATGKSASPVTSLFRSLLQSAGSLFGTNNSAAKTAQTQPQAPATPLSVILPEAAATLPPALQTAEVFTLLGQFASLSLSRSELGAILPKAKRLELSGLLKDKLSASARKELEDGEISVEKLLSLLLEAEDEENGSGSSSYLASDTYQEILKQMLKDRFSLKPEALLKKDGIADFYERLDKDLAFIEKLPSRSVDAPAFQDTAAGIRENIDFMKAINQVFPYVQLPLKLSGKNAHGKQADARRHAQAHDVRAGPARKRPADAEKERGRALAQAQ
ncbi:MAG: hypothetical protein K2O03_10440, partial [Lachnospiraceae bacterium]|nr:hypothetical protein [Lachnospiraceae bacterium]